MARTARIALKTSETGFRPIRKKGFTPFDKDYFLFLFHYTRPYLKKVVLAFLSSIPMASLATVLPFSLKKVTELFTSDGDFSQILFWMILGLASVTIKSLFELANKYILTVVHVSVSNDIRTDLYDSVQKSPLAFHRKQHSGELTNMLNNDVQVAASGVVELFSVFWQSPISILFLLAAMLYFNPLLSIFAIITVPLIGAVVTYAGKKAKEAETRYLENEGKMAGLMVESLVNVKQVKSFGLENQQREKVKRICDELLNLRKKTTIQKSIVAPASEILNVLALTLMALVAYYQFEAGYTTHSDIVGCLTAAFGLKSPLKPLSRAVVTIQESTAAVKRIKWLLNKREKSNRVLEKVDPNTKQVRFENVSFSYNGIGSILTNISFELNRGERIAIVGKSGEGKTTIADLVSGFYPPTEGTIRIDGKNIKDIDQDSWRLKIGVVTQEPFLFRASIAENIRYGYEAADDAKILEALRLAGCDEMIKRLPGGLDADVGERGGLLSGGERKRVALARALVRPISLLILDEATSELDEATEEAILSEVDRLRNDLIILNISHRKSVLKHCDKALLLKDGHIKKTSISELMNENGF